MLELKGINIDPKMPFQGLDLKAELVEFEGAPVLLYYKDANGSDILANWVDYNESTSRWIYTKVTKELLYQYLISKVSLRQILQDKCLQFLFAIDFDVRNEVQSIILLDEFSFPAEYLPSRESYYRAGLPKHLEEYFEPFVYLELLRKSAAIIKVESVNSKHHGTVGAKEGGSVLMSAVQSMEGYIEVKALNEYNKQYADQKRVKRKVNQLIEQLSPRIAQAAFNSFEVWLAIDVVGWSGESKADSILRSEIVQGYKKDVLSIDFEDEKEAESLVSKFTLIERKKIYGPLLKLLNNPDIAVSVSDNTQDIVRPSAKLKSAESFEHILLPPPSIEEIQEQEGKRTKIIALILQVGEGDDITKIRKKKFADSILFKEDLAEAEFPLGPSIEYENRTVQLSRPLRLILKVDDQNNLELSHSSLHLYAEGNDINSIVLEIKRQFVALYDDADNLKNKDFGTFRELNSYLVDPFDF